MNYQFDLDSTRETAKPENKDIDKQGELLNAITVELAYMHATNLALKGKLKEAEEVISTVYRKSSPPEVLDFYAKVLAQQKRYKDALDVWMHAIELEPGNKKIKNAISRCNSLIKKNKDVNANC